VVQSRQESPSQERPLCHDGIGSQARSRRLKSRAGCADNRLMRRKKSFGEKLTTELIGVGIKVVFLIFVFWFCFTVLPDILTPLFLDQIDNAAQP